MVKPLDNQEHLRVTEYANRVKKLNPTDKNTGRDFSLEFHDVVHETNPDRHHDHELGQDTYESSEEKDKKKDQSEPNQNQGQAAGSGSKEPPAGPLDITI